jgi:hypothetical protein
MGKIAFFRREIIRPELQALIDANGGAFGYQNGFQVGVESGYGVPEGLCGKF